MKGFGRIYSRGMLAFVVYLFFAVSYFAVSDLTRSDVIAAEATASDSQTVKAGIFSFDGYHMKDAVICPAMVLNFWIWFRNIPI